MNPDLAHVHNNYELIGLVLVLVSSWIGLLLKDWLDRRRHRRDLLAQLEGVKEQLNEVKGQVVNGHANKPPLRVDIDSVLSGLHLVSDNVDGLTNLVRAHGKDIKGITEDVGQLRDEVRDVRTDQLALERRAIAFARREHPTAGPL